MKIAGLCGGLLLAYGCSDQSLANFEQGTYEATVRGYRNDITVESTFTEDRLDKIQILEHQESIGIGTHPINMIPDKIIENQSLAVETVTGATITSHALIEAISDTVEQAGLNPEEFYTEIAPEVVNSGDVEQIETDVLVIGGGGAGLSAAIEAHREGAEVVIVELTDFLGGDTGRAGGGIEAAGTKTQEAHDVEDNAESFANHIRSRGIEYENPELLDIMTDESAASITFLEELGADMSGLVGGHGTNAPRAHRPAEGPAGQGIVQPMIAEIESLEIPVYYGTTGYELIEDENGKIAGAKALHDKSGQEYEFTADAVIIATGPFASNNEMVTQYNQRLEGLGTNSSAGSLGIGIEMAEAVGADFELMDIMRAPTNMPRSENAIAVDQDGNRFMNEYGIEDQIWIEENDPHIQAVENREEKFYWAVLDSNEFAAQEDNFSPYMLTNRFVQASSIEELADAMEVDADVLFNTINTWNEMVEGGEDTEFGREGMTTPIDNETYYAFKITPTVHNTTGGIRVNSESQVLDPNENSITGLYAAGEVVGGVHDGVSAVANAITFGRLTGQSAGAYAVSQE